MSVFLLSVGYVLACILLWIIYFYVLVGLSYMLTVVVNFLILIGFILVMSLKNLLGIGR